MKYLFFSASFLCLAACGGGQGDSLSPEEQAELEAKCAVIHKIIAARDETPAFSSLTQDDVPPGANTCEIFDEINPAESWLTASEPIRKSAYVCTYETSTSTDPYSQTRVDFTALGKRVTDCLAGWDKLGIGGISEDGLTHSAGYQYSRKGDRGHLKADGSFFAPISYAWIMSTGPEHAMEGQRVFFYVLAK